MTAEWKIKGDIFLGGTWLWQPPRPIPATFKNLSAWYQVCPSCHCLAALCKVRRSVEDTSVWGWTCRVSWGWFRGKVNRVLVLPGSLLLEGEMMCSVNTEVCFSLCQYDRSLSFKGFWFWHVKWYTIPRGKSEKDLVLNLIGVGGRGLCEKGDKILFLWMNWGYGKSPGRYSGCWCLSFTHRPLWRGSRSKWPQL